MKLIKPTCKSCAALSRAIAAYIEKADNDLEKELENAGYTDAKDSVKEASELEDEIKEILDEQTEELVEVVEGARSIENAKKAVSEYFETDLTAMVLGTTFEEFFTNEVTKLSNSYMKETEGDLSVSQLRKRTTAWISEWSEQLADIMQLTSAQKMESLLQQAMDSNQGVEVFARRLADEGIRQEGYRARRAALTEMLRAHSVARQESIMQSPATDRKKWVHSGGHKNKPRENHVDMDGQIVPKDKPFELSGRDGGTYYPMYPRDPILPPGESINCHCTHVPVSNDDILGLSYEERQQMQQEIVEADDGEWEMELNEKLRNQAGIRSGIEEEVERTISHSNTKAADKWVKTHLGISKTNYNSQNVKGVNMINRSLQRLYKEYPELNGFIDEIKITSNMKTNTVASANFQSSGGKIILKINKTYIKSPKTINLLIKQQVKEKQWTPKRGLYGILKHEMVHMLSYRKTLSKYRNVQEAVNAMERMEFAEKIKQKALKTCNLDDLGGIIQKELSKLAAKDAEEFIAEAISSSKSTKLTKTVNDLFSKELEE